jgi:hypothetical protein
MNNQDMHAFQACRNPSMSGLGNGGAQNERQRSRNRNFKVPRTFGVAPPFSVSKPNSRFYCALEEVTLHVPSKVSSLIFVTC